MPIYNIYKPIGWTPLEAMNRLCDTSLEIKNEPLTYAGRLDPMAEGVLVILGGDDRFKRDDYQNLNKTYQATFLFGFETDTYDALGLVKDPLQLPLIKGESVRDELDKLEGVHKIPFPPYSSYKIQGKPLHWWAREGRLDEIKIPLKEMEVTAVNDVLIEYRESGEVLNEMTERINIVRGDFRQSSIVDRWRNVLAEDQKLTIATLTLEVTSGTYIRSLAHDLGQKLGCGALLLNLKRTKVGDFDASDSITL